MMHHHYFMLDNKIRLELEISKRDIAFGPLKCFNKIPSGPHVFSRMSYILSIFNSIIAVSSRKPA